MACKRLAAAMDSKSVKVNTIERKGSTLLVKTVQYKPYKE